MLQTQQGDSRREGTSRLIIGLLVLVVTGVSAAGLFLLAWLTGSSGDTATWWGIPSPEVIVGALVLLGIILGGAVVLEAVSLVPALRRSVSVQGDSRERRRIDRAGGSSVRLTVVIPAHNEESTLPTTLTAIFGQSRIPDRVVVVADNCDDGTAQIAGRAGCTVLETSGNRGRKAGALNFAFAQLLPGMDSRDMVLVMDADTRLSQDFIKESIRILEQDDEVMAVGGVFMGDSRSGLLAQLQRNEFARYAHQIHSRRGRVFVLTGTATAFRASALEEVANNRGRLLPGTRGKVFAESAITEDNEITLALKSLGAHLVSPRECRVTTETMPTLSTLWTQRLRWQRGALENLTDYRLRASTARYWMQQWGLAYGSFALPLSLVGLLVVPILVGQLTFIPFWTVVAVAFSIERGVTVWKVGWRGRLIAFSLVPEVVYSLFLQVCFIRGLIGMMVSEEMSWGHLSSEQAAEAG